MDYEKALAILADEHNHYLWREAGKGWAFAHGNNHRPGIGFYPTIREAIEAEVEDLKAKAEEARNMAEAQKTRIRAFTEDAKALADTL